MLNLTDEMKNMQREAWYARIPTRSIRGRRKLPCATLAVVYDTILDLIYLNDGPIDNDPSWIAGNCTGDIKTAKCRNSIGKLIALGRIYITANGKIFDDVCRVALELSLRISLEREMGRKRRDQPKINKISRKIHALVSADQALVFSEQNKNMDAVKRLETAKTTQKPSQNTTKTIGKHDVSERKNEQNQSVNKQYITLTIPPYPPRGILKMNP